ncbi:MAG: hypothetical protein PUP93_30470 [Rhizonema sp. NSF051]|nr:hypothetical protein [Rhizonema sp. NSF051]
MKNICDKLPNSSHFKSKGIGVTTNQVPISAKFPLYIDEIIRKLPDRSQYIRDAVIAKLREDGLLP